MTVKCTADFVDHMAGGHIIERLEKVSSFEVTAPFQADRLMMTAEVRHKCVAGCLPTSRHC